MNEKIGALNTDAMGTIGNSVSKYLLHRCREIVADIEIQTMNILTKNRTYMEKVAQSLLENETIDYKKIKSIIPKKLENSQIITLEVT